MYLYSNLLNKMFKGRISITAPHLGKQLMWDTKGIYEPYNIWIPLAFDTINPTSFFKFDVLTYPRESGRQILAFKKSNGKFDIVTADHIESGAQLRPLFNTEELWRAIDVRFEAA